MRDKIKKALPYIIVNLIGAALAALSYFWGIMTTPVGFIFMIPFLPMLLIFKLEFFALIILAMLNIAACIFIIHDKSIAGLIFAIFCGSSLGTFIGTLANRDFKYAKAVRLIFNINIWLCVCWICTLLFAGSHF